MKHVRSLALGAALAVAALSYGAVKLRSPDDLFLRKAEMLDVVVRVERDGGMGSGTVIHSGRDGTFILTNHHVLPDKDAPDQAIKVRSWIYPDAVSPALPLSQEVEVVADDERKDLALLRLTNPDWRSRFVAAMLPESDHLQPTETAFVVGAGLGREVFATVGEVSLPYTKSPIPNGADVEMLSAPTIYGNSGGAAFVVRNGHYVLAGVPEAIDVATPGGSISPVSHMAYAIRMDEVRAFLERNGHGDWVHPKWGNPNPRQAATQAP